LPLGWWGAAPAFVAPYEIAREVAGNTATEGAAQCVLLHDIFGNPFQPVTINPSWLTWNDGTVVKLAKAIYEGRAFERMPVLAVALEEAGCSFQNILDHCRQPGVHTKGCWVIDMLLGKQ